MPKAAGWYEGSTGTFDDMMAIRTNSARLWWHQFVAILKDYIVLSENESDPELKERFEEAADWVEDKIKLNLGGDITNFSNAFSQLVGLQIGTLEFEERFSKFKRSILQEANNWELMNDKYLCKD